MDSFQFWIYVIVAIIYLVSKAIQKSNRQKRGQAPENRPARPDTEKTEQLPPMTFEELLREITEGKRKTDVPQPRPMPVPRKAQQPPRPAKTAPPREYVDYDDELEDEEKSLERVDYDAEKEASTLQVYERAQREVALKSSLETLKSSLRSIEPTTPGTIRVISRNTILQEYVKELKTPSGFRKAVVLSEILKPKF